MPSSMILTICISMVLKRNRGLSLDIGSRYEGAEHTKLTAITNLKSWIQSLPQTDASISSARFVFLAGSGLEGGPQTKIFNHQCGGHL